MTRPAAAFSLSWHIWVYNPVPNVSKMSRAKQPHLTAAKRFRRGNMLCENSHTKLELELENKKAALSAETDVHQ